MNGSLGEKKGCQIQIVKNILFVTALLVFSSCAISQVAQLSTTDIEKRNVAAEFVANREMGLFILQGDCSQLMNASNPTIDTVAAGWPHAHVVMDFGSVLPRKLVVD